MKYFIFEDSSAPLVARKDGYAFPEIYVNGEWVKHRNVESFAHNSKEITEKEAVKAIAEQNPDMAPKDMTSN